jgi:hypothetical protein
MSDWADLLLPLGLVCPVLSWLSVMTGFLATKSAGRGISPVFVPIIGPVLLTAFIIVKEHPHWLIPVSWTLDIGTMAFFVVFPALVWDWWTHSKFTQLVSMQGRSGIEQVHLTLHKRERYCLNKVWNRNRHDLGIVGLGESGRFSSTDDGILLIASFGLRRHLKRTGPTTYLVQEQEDQTSDTRNYSIDGWSLTADRESPSLTTAGIHTH